MADDIIEKLQSTLVLYIPYKKSTTKKLSPFNELGISPISIISKKISFMSSLDSVLGMSFNKKDEMGKTEETGRKKITTNLNENTIYEVIKRSKGRKKVIFHV